MAEEEGLGDQVERIIKKAKLDKVAEKIEKITKKPCGCQKRKEQLNQLGKFLRELNQKKPRKSSP